MQLEWISQILQDMAIDGHEATKVANREMGRLLPWNTCQYLTDKGIICSKCEGRREEGTANYVR